MYALIDCLIQLMGTLIAAGVVVLETHPMMEGKATAFSLNFYHASTMSFCSFRPFDTMAKLMRHLCEVHLMKIFHSVLYVLHNYLQDLYMYARHL